MSAQPTLIWRARSSDTDTNPHPTRSAWCVGAKVGSDLVPEEAIRIELHAISLCARDGTRVAIDHAPIPYQAGSSFPTLSAVGMCRAAMGYCNKGHATTALTMAYLRSTRKLRRLLEQAVLSGEATKLAHIRRHLGDVHDPHIV